jgi:SNF2 family DNA or RNA helicase
MSFFLLKGDIDTLLKMDTIRTKLLGYQREAIEWMISHETDAEQFKIRDEFCSGGLLADDVGLGKTIMTIGLLLGNHKKSTLIIVPKSLVNQWIQQIHKFAPTLRTSSNIDDYHTVDIVVVPNSILNTKQVKSGTSVIHVINWDRVIIDEAHILRNSTSKLYKSCMAIQATYKWALTATPVMNKMTDFINIMRWIGFSQFVCQAEKEYLSTWYIKRRTKEDVHTKKEMIPCNITVKYIQFETKEEDDLYRQVWLESKRKLKENPNKNICTYLEQLLRMRQLCIHPFLYMTSMMKKNSSTCPPEIKGCTKFNAVCKELLNIPKEDKVLIFCHFVKEIDMYMKLFPTNAICLHGKLNDAERVVVLDTFNTNVNIQFFFIQINTGSEGLNLSVANHVIITSPHWNPFIDYQAIGRVHRNGQRKPVYVTTFCIESGKESVKFIEEKILEIQHRKKAIACRILNDHVKDETNRGTLKMKEMIDLFDL